MADSQDDLYNALCDPECLKYVEDNLALEIKARGIQAPKVSAQAGGGIDWLVPFIPLILDLVRKWLDNRKNPVPAPAG